MLEPSIKIVRYMDGLPGRRIDFEHAANRFLIGSFFPRRYPAVVNTDSAVLDRLLLGQQSTRETRLVQVIDAKEWSVATQTANAQFLHRVVAAKLEIDDLAVDDSERLHCACDTL